MAMSDTELDRREIGLEAGERRSIVAYALIGMALILLLFGSYYGLFVSPPERFMGDVQRIMYVHVPTAWNSMLALTFALVAAVMYLFTSRWIWDARLEAAVEIGVVLSFLLCVQGAIWARPTWGVWWDWDPRLTTTAVMLFAFLGIVALRKFVEDSSKRAAWSAVATIIAFVDVPIVYFSVKWWNSLHQMQSTPETVSPAFYIPLRTNAFGILFLLIGLMILRSRVAANRIREELTPPPPAATRTAAGVEP